MRLDFFERLKVGLKTRVELPCEYYRGVLALSISTFLRIGKVRYCEQVVTK